MTVLSDIESALTEGENILKAAGSTWKSLAVGLGTGVAGIEDAVSKGVGLVEAVEAAAPALEGGVKLLLALQKANLMPATWSAPVYLAKSDDPYEKTGE